MGHEPERDADERLTRARQAYLGAHERLAAVARRYAALDVRQGAALREEYHDAMLAAVDAALALHAAERPGPRARERAV